MFFYLRLPYALDDERCYFCRAINKITMENNDLMLDLSEQEMLALWRNVMCLDPVRRECSVERDDGIDLDGKLITHLRQWYAHLLLTAPLEMVPVEDVKADVVLEADAAGVVTATLPATAVRPVEWQLAGWQHSVTDFLSPADARAQRQLSVWTRSGPCSPAAVLHNRQIRLYSTEPGVMPVLTNASCVVKPNDNRYVFHCALLETLPRWSV